MKRRKRRLSFITIVQSIYISTTLFFKNKLGNFSASCTFGFLFSYLPLVVIILSVLLNFMHTSPDLIAKLLNSMPMFENIFSLDNLIKAISSIKKIGVVEIVLGFWIIWMARNLFLSMIQGLSAIFHTVAKPRPVLNQFFTFIGEVMLVIAAASLILIDTTFTSVNSNPVLSSIQIQYPTIFGDAVQRTFNIAPWVAMCILISIVYKVASGTKPSWKICIICSICCTFLFLLIAYFMNIFLNVKKYNLIYGILGNLIVLLVKVKVFFNLFFTFAQIIFVHQNLDELLLAELYLLPSNNDSGLWKDIRRLIFIKPDYLTRADVNPDIRFYQKDDFIFKANELSSCVYYVLEGSVVETSANSYSFLDRGSLFGESSCFFNYPRQTDAVAFSDCKILVIEADDFLKLIKIYPEISAKVLTHISEYFNKVYGRKDGFLV